jgi:drug/metabolite transporter (DMT)-like permease
MSESLNDFLFETFRILTQRQTKGPFLIIAGCALLYLLSQKASENPSPLLYGFAALLAAVVLAGVVLMFRELGATELSAQAVPLPESSDQLEMAVTQLSKNYELLRRQLTQGFILAAVFMILGIIVILSGSVGQLFGLTHTGSNLASVAGIIMEFISGTALFMYRINFKRLGETSDKLQQTWKILTAFRLTESLPEQQKAEATMSLIKALISEK